MIDALFNDPNYLAGKKVLDAIVVRQEAIASKIANLETPGYQRVDLAPSFKSELERACTSGDAHQIGALKPTLAADPTAVPNSRDDNTVNLEREMMNLNQNTLAHARAGRCWLEPFPCRRCRLPVNSIRQNDCLYENLPSFLPVARGSRAEGTRETELRTGASRL